MGSNQDKILGFMKSMNRPVTAKEIVNGVWPNLTYSEYSCKFGNTHTTLRKLAKYGLVKKGAMLDNERLWVVL